MPQRSYQQKKSLMFFTWCMFFFHFSILSSVSHILKFFLKWFSMITQFFFNSVPIFESNVSDYLFVFFILSFCGFSETLSCLGIVYFSFSKWTCEFYVCVSVYFVLLFILLINCWKIFWFDSLTHLLYSHNIVMILVRLSRMRFCSISYCTLMTFYWFIVRDISRC